MLHLLAFVNNFHFKEKFFIDIFQQNEILLCIFYSTQKLDTDTVFGFDNIFFFFFFFGFDLHLWLGQFSDNFEFFVLTIKILTL